MLVHRYLLFKKLGTGATSEVYLGRDIETKAVYAVKILTRDITDPSELDKIQKEIDFLRQIKT